MKANTVHSRGGRWTGLARKLVCGVAAAGMAVALVPATALANDTTSKWYSLPSASSYQSFEHQATGRQGASYTYRYVTVGGSNTGRVAPMMETWYETLGLNYIDAYCGVTTIYGRSAATSIDTSRGTLDSRYTRGSMGSLESRDAELAINAVQNENPDEYIRNYCAWANGADVPLDSRATDHGNANGGVGSYPVSVGGTEYSNFPREVYMECDILGAATGIVRGDDSPATEADYAQWITLENQRANRPKTGTYNPTYLKMSINAGGGATSVKTLHTIADAVDENVVAKSVDSNGNYRLQTRYGGNTADGTGSAIDDYEDIVQATQYYTLSKIADGTVKRATTAVLVGYDPADNTYACRIYNHPSSLKNSSGADDTRSPDPDTNYYGGRQANYLADISDSITSKGLTPAHEAYNSNESEYVVWYTAKQIVENCDAAFVCDCYSSNSISSYLATAADGHQYTVYTPPAASHDEEDKTDALISARNSAIKSGKHAANFLFSYPSTMFGSFYAQGVENGMLAPITCAFTYPKLFDLTDMLGYWARNVWHIKANAVQDIVTSTCEGMDLSGGQKIGSLSSNYQKAAERIFTAGNQYYLAHRSSIDKINSGNLKTYSVSGLRSRTSSGLVTGLQYTAGSGASKATYKATSKSAVTYAKSKTSGSKVTVPATVKINGKSYKVTGVAKSAITGSKVKSATLGSNVATVSGKAFNNAKNLTKVTLGKNVKKLSKGAFTKTPKLKTIVVKSKKLAKKSAVKNAFKGSKLGSKLTVKRSGVSKKQVKKSFTKKNLNTPTAVTIK